jgi:hypothetical protein
MKVIKPRRPIEVKILFAIIAWLGLWNTFRFLQVILFWDTLTVYPIHGGPLYIAISGAGWAIVCFTLLWMVWQRKPWAWGALIGAATGAIFWAIFDRFFLQVPHGNEFFTWIAIIAMLIFVIMLIFSGNVRDYYHDR